MLLAKSILSECLVSLVILLSFSHLGDSKKRDYNGYSVIRSLPQTLRHLDFLRSLVEENADCPDREIQFWTEPIALNGSVDILVSPSKRELIQNELFRLGIPSQDMMKDVGETIRRTKAGCIDFERAHFAGNETLKQMFISSDSFYKQFQRYPAIEAKLRDLEKQDQRVSVSIIGKSSEKRNIYLVKVSNDHNAQKPVIFMDAGHHAREWISHATGIYLLESLVNTDIPRMPSSLCKTDECRLETRGNRARLNLNRYDYWFIPVVNPDGYEYSHTSDRLWRKTRSQSYCRGVDPNRNYPFHWNESGSSSFACSEIYAGPRAKSEPEVMAVTSVLDQFKDRIKMYVSLHCYSQFLLAPYGYARVYPNNYNELARIANAWIVSMNRFRGTEYKFGTSAIALYPASGGSDDYAHSIGIPLAYTVELPDRGANGFITPPSEIIPIAQETLIGLQSMIDAMTPRTRLHSHQGARDRSH